MEGTCHRRRGCCGADRYCIPFGSSCPESVLGIGEKSSCPGLAAGDSRPPTTPYGEPGRFLDSVRHTDAGRELARLLLVPASAKLELGRAHAGTNYRFSTYNG